MVSKVGKRASFHCWWFGHDWDSIHGYRNLPNDGAVCQLCERQFHDTLSDVL